MLIDYDLELEKVANKIILEKAKTVCVQLPDGLKSRAKSIVDFLEQKTNAVIIIWAGSCYGACDIPYVESLGVDLIIQWGHSEWKF